MSSAPASRVVILGVAASDSHAVANQLIAHALRARGYLVINLGTCTEVAEFAEACGRHPDALAVLIGSLNGHIHADLHDLPAARAAELIRCPVVVGGNLSVGSVKHDSDLERLYRLGVDHILERPEELFPLLDGLARRAADPAGRTGVPAAASS
ncbi:methylaspartate mutase [Streptomyces sp. LD120]|uniref:Methylaspartate mutase n=2 Tax=Streptomyces physcomitrii TaxID=2724184 RepID=A0ABX1GWG9_9ACTN|nr:methylaspartate mutase [Streptomyces physcomitrii]